MTIARWTELYLDYFNNFLTVEAFAAHYSLDILVAYEIVKIGRLIDLINPEV